MEILSKRIRELRKEKKWSQDELAKKIDSADSRQISRYETGRITPSVETTVKIAQAFDVTTDYLLIENAPRKPFIMEDKEVLKNLENIQKLSEKDRDCLFHIIDALMAKKKIKSFAQELN
jgi:transcriptional regulator with XRE-family HTH domain